MERLAAAALVAILGIAALLALPLVREGFWCDEAFSIVIARETALPAFLHDLRIDIPNPPLFNTLVAGYGRVAGFGEMPLHLFALAFGLASLAGIAALARELSGPWPAVVAVATALHAPLLTSHLAELRSYSLSVALVTFGVAALARALRSGSGRARKAAVALLALACWTHYVALFAIGSAAVVAALAMRRSAAARQVTLTNGIAAATALPLLPFPLLQLRTLPYQQPRSPAQMFALAMHKIGYALPHAGYAPPWVGLIVLVAIGIVVLLVRVRFAASLQGARGPFALLALYLVPVFAVFGPFGDPERFVIVGAALTCVVVALLFAAVDDAAGGRTRMLFRALVAAYFVASLGNVVAHASQIAAVSRTVTKSGARSLAAVARFTSRDVIVAAPDVLASTLEYYSGGRPFIGGFPQWERPAITDLGVHAAVRRDPQLALHTAERLDRVIAERRPERVFIVSGRLGTDAARLTEWGIAAFLREIEKRGALVPVGTFPGRVETLYVWEFRSGRR